MDERLGLNLIDNQLVVYQQNCDLPASYPSRKTENDEEPELVET